LSFLVFNGDVKELNRLHSNVRSVEINKMIKSIDAVIDINILNDKKYQIAKNVKNQIFTKRNVVNIDSYNTNELEVNNANYKELATNFNIVEPTMTLLREDSLEIAQTTNLNRNTIEKISIKQFVTRKISGAFLDEEKDEITRDDLLASVGINVTKKSLPLNYEVKEPVVKSKDKVVFKLGKIKIIKRN
jgi:hypothetical protein